MHNDGTYTVMKSSAYQDQPEIFIYHYDSDGKNPKGIFMSSRKNWLPYIYNDNGSASMSGPIPALVSYSYDTSSWYRVWSDGWIEQGGIIESFADVWTITFPVPFTTTNYMLQGEQWGTDATGNLGITTQTTTSASGNHVGSGTIKVSWYACGK